MVAPALFFSSDNLLSISFSVFKSDTWRQRPFCFRLIGLVLTTFLNFPSPFEAALLGDFSGTWLLAQFGLSSNAASLCVVWYVRIDFGCSDGVGTAVIVLLTLKSAGSMHSQSRSMWFEQNAPGSSGANKFNKNVATTCVALYFTISEYSSPSGFKFRLSLEPISPEWSNFSVLLLAGDETVVPIAVFLRCRKQSQGLDELLIQLFGKAAFDDSTWPIMVEIGSVQGSHTSLCGKETQ